jgi:hypothetical protein
MENSFFPGAGVVEAGAPAAAAVVVAACIREGVDIQSMIFFELFPELCDNGLSHEL